MYKRQPEEEVDPDADEQAGPDPLCELKGDEKPGTFVAEPLSVALAKQAYQVPPADFFRELRLRISCAAPRGRRKLSTFSLRPTERSLRRLREAAARHLGVEADAIVELVKLPDVLLCNDEDVLWLSDGAELHATLLSLIHI